MVLCADGRAYYKYIFEKFVKRKLNINILWLDRQEQSGRYIMLCDVLTRIPEDIQWALNRLDLGGNSMCYRDHIFRFFPKKILKHISVIYIDFF